MADDKSWWEKALDTGTGVLDSYFKYDAQKNQPAAVNVATPTAGTSTTGLFGTNISTQQILVVGGGLVLLLIAAKGLKKVLK